jgi:hypothetical protein
MKMPILGFEQHQYRVKQWSIMKSASSPAKGDYNTRLIQAYFCEDKDMLHCRRTLDQFTYHMLNDTDDRDNDQVIFRWAEMVDKSKRQHSPTNLSSKASEQSRYPLLMVDQLWLWILEDEGVVITSFPNTWETGQAYNLVNLLKDEVLETHNRPLIRNATDLANIIIKCSIDFIRRSGPMDISLLQAFQSSINNIVRAP